MTATHTLREYRTRLLALLDTAERDLETSDVERLRDAVYRRRNLRRGERAPRAQATLEPHLGTIVELLETASRMLRPRETQELDNLVAGKPETPPVVPTYPTRLHRRGTGRA